LIPCLALCLLGAGCGSVGIGSIGIGQSPGLSAQARDISVALESIDGLPRDLSQKLVRDLNEEAAALRIAVIPAGGEASYRLRGYLAAHPEGGATAVAWAWDVYDRELHRAFRLSGEERTAVTAPAGKNSEGRTWAADEALLRRIARAGMQQLAGFAASAPAPVAPTSAPTERSGAAVASRDTLPSEAAEPAANQRPARAALAGTDRLADAAAPR
jgi:hypothetical protein